MGLKESNVSALVTYPLNYSHVRKKVEKENVLLLSHPIKD